MRAGLLDKIIGIYHSVITTNDYGEEETTWELTCNTRARVISNNGNRDNINQEIVYTYNKTFEVYHHIDVDDFDRVKYNNKWYRILDIVSLRSENKKVITGELINE